MIALPVAVLVTILILFGIIGIIFGMGAGILLSEGWHRRNNE